MVGESTTVMMSHQEVSPQNDHSMIQQLCLNMVSMCDIILLDFSLPITQAQNEVIKVLQKKATAPPDG